jgi:hypothetical protein
VSQYPPGQQPYQQPYYMSLFCSACGKRNPSDAKFCNNCAKPMTAQQPWTSVQTNWQNQGWWKSQSTGIKATIVIGSLFFLFCVAGLFILEKRDEDRQSQTTTSTSTRNSIVQKPYRNLNLWKYNGITTGMTQAEVERILGSKGNQTVDSSDGSGATTSFTWQEGEGANTCMIRITYINGKVHEKSQTGLE